jgi:hypothetical protein
MTDELFGMTGELRCIENQQLQNLTFFCVTGFASKTWQFAGNNHVIGEKTEQRKNNHAD